MSVTGFVHIETPIEEERRLRLTKEYFEKVEYIKNSLLDVFKFDEFMLIIQPTCSELYNAFIFNNKESVISFLEENEFSFFNFYTCSYGTELIEMEQFLNTPPEAPYGIDEDYLNDLIKR